MIVQKKGTNYPHDPKWPSLSFYTNWQVIYREKACNIAKFFNLVKILAQVAKAMYGWKISVIHPMCSFVTQGAKVGITGATVDGILAYDNAIG